VKIVDFSKRRSNVYGMLKVTVKINNLYIILSKTINIGVT